MAFAALLKSLPPLRSALTNAVSKKFENHCPTVAISHDYNFNYERQTLRVTPLMESGLTDQVWSLEELVGL
jgi:hypothetical protein